MASPCGIATEEGVESLILLKDGRPPRGEVKKSDGLLLEASDALEDLGQRFG